jgi:predicted nucleic acid-binding protein
MRGERVVDASVVAAAFFQESFTSEARRFLLATPLLVAPDLLHAEIASVAAKKVWRGEATEIVGARACNELAGIVSTIPSASLASRAFAMAARHRFSAYDGLYLALAETRDAPLFTFDTAFARRAIEAGFGRLVDAAAPRSS